MERIDEETLLLFTRTRGIWDTVKQKGIQKLPHHPSCYIPLAYATLENRDGVCVCVLGK
jgi:hypothetical protein